MTRTLLLFLVAYLMSSCTFIVFDAPMPPGGTQLDRIPENLRGQYTYELDKMTSASVEIGENYFIRDTILEYLSDSLILKPYGKKYVLSKKINDTGTNSDGKWFCHILSPKKGGQIRVDVFCMADTTYEKKLIAKYDAKRIKANREFGDSFVFIKANLREFKKLSKNSKVTIPVMLKPIE